MFRFPLNEDSHATAPTMISGVARTVKEEQEKGVRSGESGHCRRNFNRVHPPAIELVGEPPV